MSMALSKQLPSGRLPILSFADNRSAAVSLSLSSLLSSARSACNPPPLIPPRHCSKRNDHLPHPPTLLPLSFPMTLEGRRRCCLFAPTNGFHRAVRTSSEACFICPLSLKGCMITKFQQMKYDEEGKTSQVSANFSHTLNA